MLSGGKGDTPTRIDYTEDGDGPGTSDMDLISGASASATEDEGRGVGVSRMDVEEDEYDVSCGLWVIVPRGRRAGLCERISLNVVLRMEDDV